MQDQLNTVIRQLFQKDSLGDVSEQTLRDFTEKYPYSPIGQLLLAKKLRQSKTNGFEKQAAKSVLYFNNPLWFDWLISMEHIRDNNNDEEIKDTPPPTDPLIAEAIPEEETIQEEKAEETLNEKLPAEETKDLITEEITIEEEVTEPFDDDLIENSGFVSEQPNQQQTEVSNNDSDNLAEESSFESESIIVDEAKDELQVPEQNKIILEDQTTTIGPESTDEYDDELIENIGFIPEEGNQEKSEESAPIESEHSASSEYKNEPRLQHGDNGHTEDQRTDLKKEEEFDDELIENTGFVPEVQDHTQTEASLPLASDLIEKGPEVKETVAEKADLSFEPYHTIDYFASQGIKLKQEDLEKDKFGKQLKSFTEWLRSMKKIPAAKGPQNLEVEPGDSATIRKKADESIEGKEIETETMAEVWAKQGNISKAISIYEKLSLSNPDKSHYFAAKIEQLKAN